MRLCHVFHNAILTFVAVFLAGPFISQATAVWQTDEFSATSQGSPEIPLWKRNLAGDQARRVGELEQNITRLREQGAFGEAVDHAEEILHIRQQYQGHDHWQVADARRLATLLKHFAKQPPEVQRELAEASQLKAAWEELSHQNRYGEVGPHLGRIVDIRRKHLDASSPELASALMDYAIYLTNVETEYECAERLLREAMQIREQSLGQRHPDLALIYKVLAFNLSQRGDYREGEQLCRKAISIYRDCYGEDCHDLAETYNNLTFNLVEGGKYQEAREAAQTSLDIYLRVLGLEHEQTMLGMQALAAVLARLGKHAEADYYLRHVITVRRRVLGDAHPNTWLSIHNLASNLTSQGKYAEAETLLRRVVEAWRQMRDPRYPIALTNLATCLHDQDKYDEAETFQRMALDYWKTQLGDHPTVAHGHDQLGRILLSQHKSEEALEQFRGSLAIRCSRLSESHPDTTRSYVNLATQMHYMGKFKEAQDIFDQAVSNHMRVSGMGAPHTTTALNNMARNLYALGRYDEAIASWTKAAISFETTRRNVARSGLQRALAEVATPYDSLAALLARSGKSRPAWDALEKSLARGLFDEIAAQRQQLSDSERAEGQRLVQQLQEVDEQLSVAERSGAEQASLEQIEAARDRLQMALSQHNQAITQRYGAADGSTYELARIQKHLPPDTALVAWVDLYTHPRAADPEGEHWIGVVRNTGEPIWRRIRGTGPGQSWTDGDRQLAARVRDQWSRQPENLLAPWRDDAARLAKLRVEPLEELLGEIDPTVKRLVVLPSPDLAGIPIEVLTDKYTVSYAPSATFLAWLKEREQNQESSLGPAKILAVGDPLIQPIDAEPLAIAADQLPSHGLLVTGVEAEGIGARSGLKSGDVVVSYAGQTTNTVADLKQAITESLSAENKTPTMSISRDGSQLDLKALPGLLQVTVDPRPAKQAIVARQRIDTLLNQTRSAKLRQLPYSRSEVEAIARIVPQATILLGDQASEANLEELVQSNRLRQFDYVHFATHGILDQSRPLHSFIMLSVSPPASAEKAALVPRYHDDRVTARQIMSTWSMNAELVTLSACQTGLGRAEAGEGFIGFSQALFIAGSRRVVLSLWNVDDEATALLMVRFYRNLMGTRQDLSRAMPKAEALREAKNWLRHLESEQADDVARRMSLKRGDPIEADLPAVAHTMLRYEHPYYWAGFVLIGDPD